MRRTLIIVGIVVAVSALVLVVMALIGPGRSCPFIRRFGNVWHGMGDTGPDRSIGGEPRTNHDSTGRAIAVWLRLFQPSTPPSWDPTCSFTDSERDPAGLTEEAVRAVYLGKDIEGVDFYLDQQGSNNLLNLIGQILLDRRWADSVPATTAALKAPHRRMEEASAPQHSNPWRRSILLDRRTARLFPKTSSQLHSDSATKPRRQRVDRRIGSHRQEVDQATDRTASSWWP